MKHRIVEDFIDQEFANVQTLGALRALEQHALAEMSRLRIIRDNQPVGRRTKDVRQAFTCWYFLLNRIQITAPVLLDQAQEVQRYSMLPAHERVGRVAYRYMCSFKFTPADLINVRGYQKLVRLGWFNRETNPNGVVKDHRFSVNYGWKLKVAPEIMAHPFNCEFLTEYENILKKDNCSITLEELHWKNYIK